jgi:hypothetical protein
MSGSVDKIIQDGEGAVEVVFGAVVQWCSGAAVQWRPSGLRCSDTVVLLEARLQPLEDGAPGLFSPVLTPLD